MRSFSLFVLVYLLAVALPAAAEPAGKPFPARLSEAGLERLNHIVRYEPAYVRISYPGGDVPASTGVCTDEVIRAYRSLGVDLQKEVHEDMAAHFSLYPRTWKRTAPDTNIDHRRVPNLRVFFARKGVSLPVTKVAEEYLPGDLVTWSLPGNLPHIGLVVDAKAASGRYQIVHNVGQGPKLEDVLFDWEITGHYRYAGPQR